MGVVTNPTDPIAEASFAELSARLLREPDADEGKAFHSRG